jgi:Flp pilus assembly protein TadG
MVAESFPLRHGVFAKGRFYAGRGGMGSLHNARSGVAALEFALVTPILLLMIFAMLAMGIYLMFVHEVQELASSTARSSVAGLNEAERNSLAQQFVANAVANSALLNAADVSLQTTTSGTPATNYAVTISYTLKDTPIPMLASLIAVPLNNISRTSTIEFGGY